MKQDFILIAGRPASGKTELVRLYCNENPESTLLISEEYSEEYIRERGLDPKVVVIRQAGFSQVDLSEYTTVCLDYVELFSEHNLHYIIKSAVEMNMKIIALTQMRRDLRVNNIFQDVINFN